VKLRKYRGCIMGVWPDTHFPLGFEIIPTLLRASVIITIKLALIKYCIMKMYITKLSVIV
jgi:hypothetical protein